MTDLTARITEILRSPDYSGHLLAPKIAAAAEEHYRPRVETLAQLDALPVGSVVVDGYPDAMTKLNDGWYCCSGGGRRQRYELPACVLWSPGAGE